MGVDQLHERSTTARPRRAARRHDLPAASPRRPRKARRAARRERRRQRRTPIGRHPFASGFLVVLLALTPVWVSLGSAMTNPSLGSSLVARVAEWTRDHGGRSFVAWVENEWYSHHPPKVGGTPARSAIPRFASGRTAPAATTSRSGAGGTPASTPTSTPSAAASTPTSTPSASASTPTSTPTSATSAAKTTASGAASATTTRGATAAASSPTPLPAPANLRPFASPPLAGEGVWHPVARRVDGKPAVYETFLRPDAVHTSYVVGLAWFDTKLLTARLYSGSYIPGGGPYRYTAPVSPKASRSLVAAFNAGFRMQDANGGYYTQGKTIFPLQRGGASFVIYKNGSANIGAWGTDVRMTPQVESVRQNLVLLVDHGRPAPDLNANDTTVWGYTLGNQVYVWRSAVGITADGALVYVGGPGLNITDLANLLVRAGAVRGMELDINTDWVSLSTYDPSTPTGAATPANGRDLLPNMVGTPQRWFYPWWSRDFFTMSAR